MSFLIAEGVFATKIRLEVDTGDDRAIIYVSADLTVEEAIPVALKQVPSVLEEDYELFMIATKFVPLGPKVKLSEYEDFNYLQLIRSF